MTRHERIGWLGNVLLIITLIAFNRWADKEGDHA